jgi:hypothetical protein
MTPATHPMGESNCRSACARRAEAHGPSPVWGAAVSCEPGPSGGPVAGGSLDPRSRAASALRMRRREMLGEDQVAAPLMARRAAHRARRPAHRRFQPGEGVSVQLAGLRLSGKPQRPSQGQFGHETLVLAFALIAPAASRPGQHCAVRRQRGRQVAPSGHASTVGQRFLRLVLRDDQRSGWSMSYNYGGSIIMANGAQLRGHV